MEEFNLNSEEKRALLLLSRSELQRTFGIADTTTDASFNKSEALETPCGLFVSLYNHGTLRACLGTFQQTQALCVVVKEMTQSAALNDNRFAPITKDEVIDLTIELSVLTPLKKIHSKDEITLGVHGIYIKDGYQSGTFLPQVASKTGWTVDEFLGHCSSDKARLGWNGWKTADLFTYEAIVFGEDNF